MSILEPPIPMHVSFALLLPSSFCSVVAFGASTARSECCTRSVKR